jgi:formyltetrahydrofolate synthetase
MSDKFLSDIEIAQNAEIEVINKIAEKIGIQFVLQIYEFMSIIL